MKKFKAWFLLLRPWSLTATAVPFMLFAFVLILQPWMRPDWRQSIGADWSFNLVLAFIAAAALQIACNLLNTWGDNRSGVDNVPDAYVTTPQIMQGYATPKQVFLLALVFLAVTLSVGTYLLLGLKEGAVSVNWLLLIIGIIGVMGASNYATLLKFKYHGLGTPFVFFLMGPIFYIGIFACLLGESFFNHGWQEQVASLAVVTFISMPVASLVSVILFGNDMRDRLTDEAAGIKTLATILKPKKTLVVFWCLHLYPYLHWIATAVLMTKFERVTDGESFSAKLIYIIANFLPFVVFPATFKALKRSLADYRKEPQNPYWFGYERESGKIHFLFGIFYSLSMALIIMSC